MYVPISLKLLRKLEKLLQQGFMVKLYNICTTYNYIQKIEYPQSLATAGSRRENWTPDLGFMNPAL